MFKTKRTIAKISCGVLALVMGLTSLVACGKKESPTYSATAVVGTVDSKNVYYDELYYLVKNYLPSVRESASDDTAARKELERLIGENIVANYAILGVCENVGLTYDERELKDEVDESLELMRQSSFGGDEKVYKNSLAEAGLTERYLRYTLGIDLLYEELLTVYPQKGLVASDETSIRAYIEKNFIHVYHVAVFNDEGDSTEENFAAITTARNKLIAGEASMRDLIGSKVNEDVLDISGNGYYITRGTMDEAYEAAAFALEIGGVSEVVEAIGENNYGVVVPCYYVIQRHELDQDYIDSHLYELQDEYYSSVIYTDMNEIKESLSFVPNDLYGELDLLNLPTPDESENGWGVALWIVGGLAAVCVIVILTVQIIRKKKKKAISTDESKSLNAGGSHERS